MATPKRKPSAKSSKKSKTIEKNRIAQWLESNFRTIAFGILGLAFLFRVWLLIELPRMPFSRMEKNPDLDMAFFDTWADRIAHGDFLTDTILHPYHTWHKQAAEAMGVSNDQEGKERWNKIYGGKTYHQEPFYPQVLGIAKMLGGDGHFLMYILQMLSTLLSIWMVIWLGRHYFGELAGLSAGLLFTLYSPGLLFDVMLLRTSFTTCYALGLLVVSEQLIVGKNKPWFFGLLGGIGYLLQTSMMLLWIPLLVRWLYLQKGDVRRSWQVVLGFFGVLSLLMIRNSIVGAPLMSDSSVGPVTYVLSNFPAYHPQLGFAVFVEIGKVMEITHGKMLASMLYIIGKHHTAWQWVSLQFEKLFMVFQWYEVPNNVNSYVPRMFSMPLKLSF
ncbi:MAG TPA: glycosyltransferase family 39 protein, partial [Saprospiraceae bacterium]|nr:glycosyltransferase family 39 protein [Saprospiraceae bacterium]